MILTLLSQSALGADYTVEFSPAPNSISDQEVSTLSSSKILNFAQDVLSSISNTLSAYLKTTDIPTCTSSQILAKSGQALVCVNISSIPGLTLTDGQADSFKKLIINASCTVSGCTFDSLGSPNIVSSIPRASAGNYSITFTANQKAPTYCDCQAVGNHDQSCHIYGLTASGISVVRTYSTTGNVLQESSALRIYCEMPR